MARYIDADALKKKAEMRGLCIRPLVTAFQMCVTVHDIDNAPTVDAEPVRHGRWIYKYFDSYCSVCGWENKADTVTRVRNDYPYCPHCGAKMDEEVQ